jgi:hypothetical protein
VNVLIFGGGMIANEAALVPVPDGVVTEIGPFVAPAGTWAVMLVGELSVKLAPVPLNVTLLAPVNPAPLIDTLVPVRPLVGVNELMVGGAATVNDDELLAVPAGVVTETGPVSAPLGTVAWICESETTVKSAPAPLTVTLLAPVKPVPVIDTLVPVGPLVGVNAPIVGGVVIVNDDELVAVPPGVVTETDPVSAPLGTVAWICESETTLKSALAPSNFTPVAPVKLVPVIEMLIPAGPPVGVSETIVGGGSAHEPVNHEELQAPPPGVETEIGPGSAKLGTTAWSFESESTVTELAGLPLNPTSVAPGTKREPTTSMLAPTGPQVGVNELIVGGTPKGDALVPVPFCVVTEIAPVFAPSGTVAWISVSESTVKLAATPPNVTALAPVKFSPTMSTVVPGSPFDGVNDLIVGAVRIASSTSTSSKMPVTQQPLA